MGSKYLYEKTISNKYLGKSKSIKASSLWELDNKVNVQIEAWNNQVEKAKEKDDINDRIIEAKLMTIDVQKRIESYKNILHSSLSNDYRVDWDSLKRKPDFPDNFMFDKVPPSFEAILKEYKVPKESPIIELFFDSIRKSRENLEKAAQEYYNMKIQEYENEKAIQYNEYITKKNAHVKEVDLHNSIIDKYKSSFEKNEYDTEAIEKYVTVVLERAYFLEKIDIDIDVQYKKDTKTLIVLFKMPSPEDIPNIVEYSFAKAKKELIAKVMKPKDFEDFYGSIVYQTALKVNYILYQSFYVSYIDNIVFNGWVRYIDKATGKPSTSCILSLQTSKEEFEEINLQYVDPKECIKNLKGIYAGKLINLAPVQPIQDIDKSDKRFVESKKILANINSIKNLTTMDWEDFEHLVTELFEKEFSGNGSEIKVTRASRDGGIDAVMFNSDPLKGGKMVIQAKRYNNVVPVSAVRDLYGTMQHEGAMKGILVTTSDYGKDAHEFIKNKPLALINGQELLYYFNKHGYNNVKIELTKL